jgi:hypothetical protein
LTEPSATSVAKPKTETPEGSPTGGNALGADAKLAAPAMVPQGQRVPSPAPPTGAPGCGAP